MRLCRLDTAIRMVMSPPNSITTMALLGVSPASAPTGSSRSHEPRPSLGDRMPGAGVFYTPPPSGTAAARTTGSRVRLASNKPSRSLLCTCMNDVTVFFLHRCRSHAAPRAPHGRPRRTQPHRCPRRRPRRRRCGRRLPCGTHPEAPCSLRRRAPSSVYESLLVFCLRFCLVSHPITARHEQDPAFASLGAQDAEGEVGDFVRWCERHPALKVGIRSPRAAVCSCFIVFCFCLLLLLCCLLFVFLLLFACRSDLLRV